MKNKIMVMFLAIITSALVSCSSDDNNKEVIVDTGNATALVELEVTKTEEDQASVTVVAKNIEKIMYLYAPKGKGSLGEAEVLKEGKELPVQEKQEVIIGDLEANTEYEIAAVGLVKSKAVVLKKVTFKTLEKVVDDVLVLKDGFLKYDELDDASGYYRTNIILSSDVMKENGSKGQIDILLWVYTSYPLDKAKDKNRFKVPFGVVTPFFTNGTGLTDMMYYIGKHKKDANGEANFEGTAWVDIDDKGKEAYFVADDTKNTRIEIKDNKDGTYTIFGVLVDQTKKSELKFTYTDNKDVFGIW